MSPHLRLRVLYTLPACHHIPSWDKGGPSICVVVVGVKDNQKRRGGVAFVIVSFDHQTKRRRGIDIKICPNIICTPCLGFLTHLKETISRIK